MGENLIWGEINGKWGLVVSAPQPQTFTGQAPVAWEQFHTPDSPLYTAPSKREWVGLTDEDFYGQSELQVMAMKYAEAKLKEKNSCLA